MSCVRKGLCWLVFLLLFSGPLFAWEKVSFAPSGSFPLYRHLAERLACDLISHLHEEPQPFKIVVTSFLNEDDFSLSSPLGRILAELVAEELHERGFVIYEPRLTRQILLRKKTGEIVLSREAKRVFQEIGAQAVVTGVISEEGGRLILQAKMVSLADSRLYSLASVEIINWYPGKPSVYDVLP